MNKYNVCVMTDSNSGIMPDEGHRAGIEIIPMPVIVDGREYLENETITREQFFEWQEGGADIVTSQPSPEMLTDRWREILKQYDYIVYIPMSSGLSSSCQTAAMLAQDFDGKVLVADNHRISVSQKESALEAKYMADNGKTAAEIRDFLETHSYDASIYIAMDTLKYLKKGGRITPAGAAVATALNLKPILQFQGEKLDAFSKARGLKSAYNRMLEAADSDIGGRFAGKKVIIHSAYSSGREAADEWVCRIREHFPEQKVCLDPLALSACVHIGPRGAGIGIMVKYDDMPEFDFKL